MHGSITLSFQQCSAPWFLPFHKSFWGPSYQDTEQAIVGGTPQLTSSTPIHGASYSSGLKWPSRNEFQLHFSSAKPLPWISITLKKSTKTSPMAPKVLPDQHAYLSTPPPTPTQVSWQLPLKTQAAPLLKAFPEPCSSQQRIAVPVSPFLWLSSAIHPPGLSSSNNSSAKCLLPNAPRACSPVSVHSYTWYKGNFMSDCTFQ